MIVRELITRLGFNLNQGQLNKAEQGIEKVKQQANNAAFAVRGMVASLIGIAAIQNVTRIGDEMQSLRARLSLLPQTVGDAGAAFDEVAKRASASGVSISAYASLYTRVGNAAKDYIKTQEDLLGITDTISQALTVGGASTQEASAVMTQFSQALAAGVLQGDEFMSMATAAPQYMDKLSETMGIPRDQLKKMGSDGKLTAKEVIEATRKMSDFFETKFKAMPMTTGRAMTEVGNRFSQMIDHVNRETRFIEKIAAMIIDGFGIIESGIDKLTKSFGGFGNMLRYIGVTIGVVLGAKTIQIVRLFGLTFLRAMIPVIAITSAILLVGAAIDDLIVFINGGNSVIGDFINWLNSATVAAGLTKIALIMLGGAAAAAALLITGKYLAALSLMLFKTAAVGVAALVAGAKIAAGWLIALWPVALFIAAVAAVGAIIYGLIKIIPFIGSAMSAAADVVLEYWGKVKTWFSDFFGWFGQKYEAVKNFLGFSGQTTASNVGGVSPAQMSPSAMGQGSNINQQTTVNVTVPPGTTAEQSKFLQDAASKSFGGMSSDKFARDLGTYAP